MESSSVREEIPQSQFLLGQKANIIGMLLLTCHALFALTPEHGNWGSLIVAVIAITVLLLWKNIWSLLEVVRPKRQPLPLREFLILACLILGCQFPAQLMTVGAQCLGELLGSTASQGKPVPALALWLYACLMAPVLEELLFRGLVLGILRRYGRKFAVMTSALLFGLYHANPVQTPYGILLGLILGYTAVRYHLAWSITLHVLNNAMLISAAAWSKRLFPGGVADIFLWVILTALFLIALLVLLAKAEKIGQRLAEETTPAWCKRAFWRAPAVVLLCVVCALRLCQYFL